MIYVGGTRERLVQDSLYYKVKNGLDALGWFNPHPTGYSSPVTMIPEQVPWDKEVARNTITVALENIDSEEWELGFDTFRNEYTFYIDLYAENDALGRQISGDIRDLLRGKFPNLGVGRGGYSQPTVDVYDYTQATPPWIFFCDIENVVRDRSHRFTFHWQQFWYVIRLTVIDYYGSTADDFAYGSDG